MAEPWDESNSQQRILALAADIGSALTCADTQEEMLQKCAQALVDRLDVAFARMWIFDEKQQLLQMVASAGMYTHTNGAHSQIKLGQFKIGVIAQERKPHLTNEVQGDPMIQDQQWAIRENLVSFAGIPLLVQDRLLGVMALFSHRPLNEDILWALNSVADGLSIGVHRKQIEAELRKREELFSVFANNMRDVLWITSPGGMKHIYVSPAYEKMYGRPVQELLDNPLSFVDTVIPEDRPVLIRLMTTDDGNPIAEVSDIEYRIRRPDGEVRWLWTRAFPMLDENGVFYQVCGVTHDITEKKEAERRVSEFYSMVSHELRTPLTSIRAALGLIEGGMTGSVPDDTLDLISIARSESDRLIRLINDILDMRKMEAGKLPLNLVPLDPHEVLVKTVAAMRGFAQEHGVELVSWINDDYKFLGDDDRVVQVLTNLLSNAIKFSPEGSEVTVSVERTANGNIRFSVTDKGPGIPKALAHKLFGIFQQLDSSDSRARGGTGLGLAISKAIVERLGGTIGFNSEVGVGSTFWFELLPEGATPLREEPLLSTEERERHNGNESTLQEMLDAYAKNLPTWLNNLSAKLKLAKQEPNGASLAECVNIVKRVRASAEPCGFADVAALMTDLEYPILQLIKGEGEPSEAWEVIDRSMESVLAVPLMRSNNK
jgi:PAS domain S-box-containing protein